MPERLLKISREISQRKYYIKKESLKKDREVEATR